MEYAQSVPPADALTRPLAPGGALGLAVPSPLIPFVDPLPLPRRLLAQEHGDRLVVDTGTAVHRFHGVDASVAPQDLCSYYAPAPRT